MAIGINIIGFCDRLKPVKNRFWTLGLENFAGILLRQTKMILSEVAGKLPPHPLIVFKDNYILTPAYAR